MSRLVPFCVALVACAGEPDPSSDTGIADTQEALGDLGAPGPWSVGTVTREITGADGEALVVQYWYPTLEPGASPVVYDGLLLGAAYENAPADCSTVHPMLAFSHGFGGTRYQSPFFTEHLASHGWVVVAPDHRGNTFVDQTGDFLELVVRRPQDIQDTVGAALVDPLLSGCASAADGYAVAGHSFGGYTALAGAGAEVNTAGGPADLGDPRIWAVLGMAPWDAVGAITTGTADITVPAMLLTGERDLTVPLAEVEGLFDPMKVKPRFLGLFPDAGHYSFSPVACLLNTTDGCGPDYLDLDVFTELVNRASLAFLDDALGIPGALDQLPTDAPELHWETH